MGAIVSHRKGPSARSNVGARTAAVNAFSGPTKYRSNNNEAKGLPPQGDTKAQSPAPSIAILSWGQGVVGTSSHEMLNTGVVTSRGIGQEVITSGKLYPDLQQKSHENVRSITVLDQKLPSRASTSNIGDSIGNDLRGFENDAVILTVTSIGPKKDIEEKHREPLHTQSAVVSPPPPPPSKSPTLNNIDITNDYLRVKSFGPKEPELDTKSKHLVLEDLDNISDGTAHEVSFIPDTTNLHSAVQVRSLSPYKQSRETSTVTCSKEFVSNSVVMVPYVARDSGINAQSLVIKGQGTLEKLPVEDAAIKIQSVYRGYRERKQIQEQNQAAEKIQRHVRGHLARKESKQRIVSAKFIQRHYRRYLENRKKLGISSPPAPIPENYELEDSDEEEYNEANPNQENPNSNQGESSSSQVDASSSLVDASSNQDEAINNLDEVKPDQDEASSSQDGATPTLDMYISKDETMSTQDAANSSKTKSVKFQRPWRETPAAKPILNKEVKIGEKTKQEFAKYQDDITDLKWHTEQQIEMSLMSGIPPPKVLLISSKVPRADVLNTIVLKEVITIYYDFASTSFDDLIENIKSGLEAYKSGCKAKNIAIVCQGGPGFMYPIKGKVFTLVKVKTDEEVKSFLVKLGLCMSKIDQETNKLHVIGNNVAGNKLGEKLLKKLSKVMKVTVKSESPLEMSQSGREMLEQYFDYGKYLIWKRQMHLKVSFKL